MANFDPIDNTDDDELAVNQSLYALFEEASTPTKKEVKSRYLRSAEFLCYLEFLPSGSLRTEVVGSDFIRERGSTRTIIGEQRRYSGGIFSVGMRKQIICETDTDMVCMYYSHLHFSTPQIRYVRSANTKMVIL